jgi:hypothetical protein
MWTLPCAAGGTTRGTCLSLKDSELEMSMHAMQAALSVRKQRGMQRLSCFWRALGHPLRQRGVDPNCSSCTHNWRQAQHRGMEQDGVLRVLQAAVAHVAAQRRACQRGVKADLVSTALNRHRHQQATAALIRRTEPLQRRLHELHGAAAARQRLVNVLKAVGSPQAVGAAPVAGPHHLLARDAAASNMRQPDIGLAYQAARVGEGFLERDERNWRCCQSQRPRRVSVQAVPKSNEATSRSTHALGNSLAVGPSTLVHDENASAAILCKHLNRRCRGAPRLCGNCTGKLKGSRVAAIGRRQRDGPRGGTWKGALTLGRGGSLGRVAAHHLLIPLPWELTHPHGAGERSLR